MSREGAERRDEVILAQAVHEAYRLSIMGTSHLNFTDIFLWVSQFQGRFLGSINPRRAVEVMNAYTLAFFDRHLKNKAAALLNGSSSQYPEAVIESYNDYQAEK
ncbi:MAG: hypothetical protein WAM60_08940 [Candidatus Promineifilaceae bacterium]